jgi:hypothetical protein
LSDCSADICQTSRKRCRACGSPSHSKSTKRKCPKYTPVTDSLQKNKRCRSCESTSHVRSTKLKCSNYNSGSPLCISSNISQTTDPCFESLPTLETDNTQKNNKRCHQCGSTSHLRSTKSNCPNYTPSISSQPVIDSTEPSIIQVCNA